MKITNCLKILNNIIVSNITGGKLIKAAYVVDGIKAKVEIDGKQYFIIIKPVKDNE